MSKTKFKLQVNGKTHRVKTDPDEPLLWVLRDMLGLTGTKFGCGEGVCGACSVLVDGEAVRSCVIPISSVSSSNGIITIEGLSKGSKLSPLQKSFIEHTAFQCGFCTPGMIINAAALLERNPYPSREEIIAAMDGNLCRCGSYVNIIEAIEAAARAGN